MVQTNDKDFEEIITWGSPLSGTSEKITHSPTSSTLDFLDEDDEFQIKGDSISNFKDASGMGKTDDRNYLTKNLVEEDTDITSTIDSNGNVGNTSAIDSNANFDNNINKGNINVDNASITDSNTNVDNASTTDSNNNVDNTAIIDSNNHADNTAIIDTNNNSIMENSSLDFNRNSIFDFSESDSKNNLIETLDSNNNLIETLDYKDNLIETSNIKRNSSISESIREISTDETATSHFAFSDSQNEKKSSLTDFLSSESDDFNILAQNVKKPIIDNELENDIVIDNEKDQSEICNERDNNLNDDVCCKNNNETNIINNNETTNTNIINNNETTNTNIINNNETKINNNETNINKFGPAFSSKQQSTILIKFIGDKIIKLYKTTTKRYSNNLLVDKTIDILEIYKPVLPEITENSFKNTKLLEITGLSIKNIRTDYPKIKDFFKLKDQAIFNSNISFSIDRETLNTLISEGKGLFSTANDIFDSISNVSSLSPLEINVLRYKMGLNYSFHNIGLSPNLFEQVALLNNPELTKLFVFQQKNRIEFLIAFFKLGLLNPKDFEFVFSKNLFYRFLISKIGINSVKFKESKSMWNVKNIVDYGISKILNVEKTAADSPSPLKNVVKNINSIANKGIVDNKDINDSRSAIDNNDNIKNEKPINGKTDININAFVDKPHYTESTDNTLYETVHAKPSQGINSCIPGKNKIEQKKSIFDNSDEDDDLFKDSIVSKATNEPCISTTTPPSSFIESDKDLLTRSANKEAIYKHMNESTASVESLNDHDFITNQPDIKSVDDIIKDEHDDIIKDERGIMKEERGIIKEEESNIIKDEEDESNISNTIKDKSNIAKDEESNIVKEEEEESNISNIIKDKSGIIKDEKSNIAKDEKSGIIKEEEEESNISNIIKDEHEGLQAPLYKKKFSKSFADIFTLENDSENTAESNVDLSSYVSDVSEKDKPILQAEEEESKGSVISNIFGFFKKKSFEPPKSNLMQTRMSRPLKAEIQAPEKKERKKMQNAYANMKDTENLDIPGFKPVKK